VSYHVIEVGFDHRDTYLAGDVWLPDGVEEFPVVVMVPGSGLAERNEEAGLREHLVRHGIASFAWDKPGLGGSAGDWRRQTIITDRAEEVRGALRALQSRPDIGRGGIGLWGISQGGWIVPLVAATTPNVAFIITVSAPGISVAEQILYSYAERLRAGGLPDEWVVDFAEFLRAALDAARAGMSYEDVEASLVNRYRSRPWLPAIAPELTPSAWEQLLAGEAPDLDFHLEPILERVECPVLAVFGANDDLLPVDASVALFEEGLARAGNSDVTVIVFADADHFLRVQDPPGYAPGYLETLSDWVRARGGAERGRDAGDARERGG
jgi:uncharacterized protein